MVLNNGETPWTASEKVGDLLVTCPEPLRKFQPEQKYFLWDETRLSPLLLENAKGESAFIFRFEQASGGEEVIGSFRDFKRALSGKRKTFLERAVIA
ncbi:MAG: hypothetical protein K2H64_02010 [Desulfovibrio sp.]|nr:hypothetical protein [Desulfovibrio sp.]